MVGQHRTDSAGPRTITIPGRSKAVEPHQSHADSVCAAVTVRFYCQVSRNLPEESSVDIVDSSATPPLRAQCLLHGSQPMWRSWLQRGASNTCHEILIPEKTTLIAKNSRAEHVAVQTRERAAPKTGCSSWRSTCIDRMETYNRTGCTDDDACPIPAPAIFPHTFERRSVIGCFVISCSSRSIAHYPQTSSSQI
jgi:hypothetical protein